MKHYPRNYCYWLCTAGDKNAQHGAAATLQKQTMLFLFPFFAKARCTFPPPRCFLSSSLFFVLTKQTLIFLPFFPPRLLCSQVKQPRKHMWVTTTSGSESACKENRVCPLSGIWELKGRLLRTGGEEEEEEGSKRVPASQDHLQYLCTPGLWIASTLHPDMTHGSWQRLKHSCRPSVGWLRPRKNPTVGFNLCCGPTPIPRPLPSFPREQLAC